jgi:hypothetical protein
VTVGPSTGAAANVALGWLGHRIPPVPKHRNQARASYCKTQRQRDEVVDLECE